MTATYSQQVYEKIMAMKKSFQWAAFSNDEGRIINTLMESLQNGGVKSLHQEFHKQKILDHVTDTENVGFIMELLFVLFGHDPTQSNSDDDAFFRKRISDLIGLLDQVQTWKPQGYEPLTYTALRNRTEERTTYHTSDMARITQYNAPKRQRT